MTPLTPRMTKHALARCREMGIKAKVAKAIVRNAELVYPGPRRHGECWVAVWSGDPKHVVAYFLEGDRPVVATVLYRGIEHTRPDI